MSVTHPTPQHEREEQLQTELLQMQRQASVRTATPPALASSEHDTERSRKQSSRNNRSLSNLLFAIDTEQSTGRAYLSAAADRSAVSSAQSDASSIAPSNNVYSRQLTPRSVLQSGRVLVRVHHLNRGPSGLEGTTNTAPLSLSDSEGDSDDDDPDLGAYDISVLTAQAGSDVPRRAWSVRRSDAEMCHCFRKLRSMDPVRHPLPEVPSDPWASVLWLNSVSSFGMTPSQSETSSRGHDSGKSHGRTAPTTPAQSVRSLHSPKSEMSCKIHAICRERAHAFEALFASVLRDTWLVHHGDFTALLGSNTVATNLNNTIESRDRDLGSTHGEVDVPIAALTETERHCLLTRWVRVGRPLGKGCFGTVYMGQLENAEQVAVKVIDLSTLPDQSAQDAFASEFAVMEGLSHPNIIQYLGHSFNTEEQQLQIYLELCSNGTVAELVQNMDAKRLVPSVMRTYIRQVLLGIEYLHGLPEPVVHRDIKGANLLVTKEGCIKLSDFGCSKMLDEFRPEGRVGTSTMVGTPFWMAPEVISPQEGAYGTECDIWSLGCTVIEMLGETPWGCIQTDSPWEILYHIANAAGPPPFPEGIEDHQLLDFMNSCFERKPQDRLTATALLKHPYILH